MVENGLLEETKHLLQKHGRIPKLVNCAKRQLTWFRRNEEIKWDIYPEKLKK